MSSAPPHPHHPGYAYCPRDGLPMTPAPQPDGRTLPVCRQCGFVDYGNPKPCVAVLLINEGRLLLARRAVEPAKGLWDIPGGFIDAHETAEDAVHREMREETGLEIRITGYLGSFPDTYGADGESTLSFCFLAETIRGTPSAQSDVAELRWFSPTELPRTMAFPHQPHLLQRWQESITPDDG